MSEPLPLFAEEVQKSAVISPCGTYRYELTRRWSDGPPVGWVMLNPSTADANLDDPTIRRCIAFAKAWGYGGIVVRNLYALRATDPRELDRHSEPIGPDNDAHLARCVGEPLTIVAWGARGGDRGREVLGLLASRGVRPHLLATTGDGQPRHPLYLRADLLPVPVQEVAR
ncbi:DUF1643 domain-containing protein [Amycolatopsis taiwanensis]|uniref:DUF1643 domain-containing protein n=1 Tax=Amycolatopsis taiwanensis TaxID=342230 RepID=UPI0004874D56|nr:DUF1643 domain-containing protein [Amycolatopsis taiwanensis]